MVTWAVKYRNAINPSTGAKDPYRALACARRCVSPIPMPVRTVQTTADKMAPGRSCPIDGARGERIQKETTNSATLRTRASKADSTTPPDHPNTDPSEATKVDATIP